jgi:hypothetical protein
LAKIAEIVSVHSGYSSTVDLRSEFEDPGKNQTRMERYRPTKGHRRAFEKISNVVKPKDKRVYLLTGSYGTGKSHLSLMVANYLSNKTDAPELQGFLANYSLIDPDMAEKLRALRSQGRYLTAICDYHNKDDFAEIILQAVDTACRREGFEEELQTHFQEALRWLKQCREDEKNGTAKIAWWSHFESELGQRYPGETLNKLQKDLGTYSEQAMRVFREVYRSIAGSDFSFNKSNLVPILKDFLSAVAFKAKYKGLVILFDEFGYTLQNQRLSVEIFQGFAQLCTQGEKGCQDLIFIATGHRSFQNYAEGWSKADFSKVSDRIEEIPLVPEGIEDIISAIVMPDKSSTAWKEEVAGRSGVFSKLASECSKNGLFDWLKPAEIRTKIVENIYPMHPVATYCLLKLAQDVGSNNRSVFTFFSGEFHGEEGSFPWFIDNHEILQGNLLRLYTPDLLTLFFAHSLRSDNKELRDSIRRVLQNYESTLREYKKLKATELVEDEALMQILRTMLVYELAGLNNNLEMLMFGLHPQEDGKRSILESRLQLLTKGKVLFYDRVKKCYEFKRSESIDFDDMLQEYHDDPQNIPTDLAQDWMSLVPLNKDEIFVEARSYNLTYGEDKRFLRWIALPGELKTPDFYSRLQEKQEGENDWKNSYEGTAVYVLCQSGDEIEKARQYAASNFGKNIAVAIPNEPIRAREIVMNIKAVQSIMDAIAYENYSTQDKARLVELLGNASTETGYLGDLTRARRKLFEGKICRWFGKQGVVLEHQPAGESAAVDRLTTELYRKRNQTTGQDLNLSHRVKAAPSQNQQLKDAVAAILDWRNMIKVDTEYGTDKGIIRYIYKLATVGLYTEVAPATGKMRYYTAQKDTVKYAAQCPALADLVKRIQELPDGDEIKIRDLVRELIAPPYGLGPVSLALFFSIMMRICGDTVRIKKDPTSVGDWTVRDYDNLYDLLYDKYPGAVIRSRAISDEERQFLKKLGELLMPAGTVGKVWSVNEVIDGFRTWWAGLPTIARSPEAYPTTSPAPPVLQMLSMMEQADSYNLIFSDLQERLGFASDDAITVERLEEIAVKLKLVIDEVKELQGKIQQELAVRLGQEFAADLDTFEGVREAIQNWYKGLEDHQKTVQLGIDAKALLKAVQSMETLPQAFFGRLPKDYGFGAVADWTRNRVEEYVAKLRHGKQEIDAAKLKVQAPAYSLAGNVTQQQDGHIRYRKQVEVTISVPDGAAKVFVTDNGEDPGATYSQRLETKDQCELKFVSGNKTIRFVAVDSEGNFSQEIQLDIADEDKQYEFTEKATLFEKTVACSVPKDRDTFEIAASSLVKYCIEKKLVSRKEVEQVLRGLLKSLD